MFCFRKLNPFKILDFKINGVPQQVQWSTHSHRSRVYNKKTGKYINLKNRTLKFDSQSGYVELKVKYQRENEQPKIIDYNFYIPYPAPTLFKKIDQKNRRVILYWNNCEEYYNSADFTQPPSMILTSSHRLLKKAELFKAGQFVLPEDLPEKMFFKLELRGFIQGLKWTSKAGLQKVPVPFSGSSQLELTMPDKCEARAVRVQVIKSDLVYENSGIPTMKLLHKLISRIRKDKDIVAYDTEARDYLINEKLFALSNGLREKLKTRKADFALQVRDFSRSDGNGIELWLFKRDMDNGFEISGSSMTFAIKGNKLKRMGLMDKIRRTGPHTLFWKIAELKLDGDEKRFNEVAERIISKIKENANLFMTPEQTSNEVAPKNIVFGNITPVNQKHVLWNYRALSESFSLLLAENCSQLKILSKEDWDLIIQERLRSNNDGYGIINNKQREVLISGRMWRKGKDKALFLKVSDAFTGKLISSKIFDGTLQNLAKEVSQWIKTLRIAPNDRKDFVVYHSPIIHGQPTVWHIGQRYLERYAPIFIMPEVKTRVQSLVRTNFSPLTFANRQWKDGYRDKAVAVLEAEWKKTNDLKTGLQLMKYYSILNYKNEGVKLCNMLVLLDRCPNEVLTYYEKFKAI